MKKFVVVTKGGGVETKNVQQFSFETLYKKCKFRSSNGFQKRHTWKWKDGFISVFARDHGRAGGENKYDLPPPVDTSLFFGMLALVYHKNEVPEDDEILNLEDSEWLSCYEKLFGGFEDLGEEEEEEEVEEIPEEYKTKQGYSKEDGFIVDDNEPLLTAGGDSDEEEEWDSKQNSDSSSLDDDDEEDEDAVYGHDSTDESSEDEECDDDEEEDEDEDDGEIDNDSELGEEEYTYK